MDLNLIHTKKFPLLLLSTPNSSTEPGKGAEYDLTTEYC